MYLSCIPSAGGSLALCPAGPQVVLEGLDANVKRGRCVFEEGHVSGAPGHAQGTHKQGLTTCNLAMPRVRCLGAPFATRLRSAPCPPPQIVLLSWCTSQRDLEVVRKIVAQTCLAYKPEGGTTVGGRQQGASAHAHRRPALAAGTVCSSRAGRGSASRSARQTENASACLARCTIQRRPKRAKAGQPRPNPSPLCARASQVVVMSARSKLEMEAIIARDLPPERRHGTKIVCRQGSPLIPNDLALVSAHTARAALIISDQSRSAAEADAQSLRCVVGRAAACVRGVRAPLPSAPAAAALAYLLQRSCWLLLLSPLEKPQRN